MSMLKEQSTLLRDFLRTGFKKNVLLCAIGLIAAGVVGYFIGIMYPDVVQSTIQAFFTNAENAGVIQEDGSISTLALLANNWTAMLIAAAYGFIPFLFIPVTTLCWNGFILGISGALYQLNGLSFASWISGLLPHGIFELTAFVLSVACGFHLCISISRVIIGSPNRAPMVETLCDLLRILLLLVAPMTIVAAFIEVYVTPVIMALFM